MTSQPKVVAIGGGTGLATVLRSLKNYPISLSAIVTMTDNGASSGRLSREMGILPPGDVRKCLAALANDEQLLTQLFEYRFKRGRGISGHSVGNLLLLALTEISGSFDQAVAAMSKILSVKGRVIPSTLEHVSLLAKLGNGQMALGEVDIPIGGHRFGIKDITLVPTTIPANPTALHFINQADCILVGPGSLYTSVLPNFLIPEIRQAFEQVSAKKYFIVNCSTERGETEHCSVGDHLDIMARYIKLSLFDGIIVNQTVIIRNNKEGKLGSISNITTDEKKLHGRPVILADLIDDDRPLYHDPKKLGQVIWQALTQ